jgi:hypothetical protein
MWCVGVLACGEWACEHVGLWACGCVRASAWPAAVGTPVVCHARESEEGHIGREVDGVCTIGEGLEQLANRVLAGERLSRRLRDAVGDDEVGPKEVIDQRDLHHHTHLDDPFHVIPVLVSWSRDQHLVVDERAVGGHRRGGSVTEVVLCCVRRGAVDGDGVLIDVEVGGGAVALEIGAHFVLRHPVQVQAGPCVGWCVSLRVKAALAATMVEVVHLVAGPRGGGVARALIDDTKSDEGKA